MTKRTPLSMDMQCVCEWKVDTTGHGAMRLKETEGSLKVSKEGARGGGTGITKEVVVIWSITGIVMDRLHKED